jgi:hypothetical protein
MLRSRKRAAAVRSAARTTASARGGLGREADAAAAEVARDRRGGDDDPAVRRFQAADAKHLPAAGDRHGPRHLHAGNEGHAERRHDRPGDDDAPAAQPAGSRQLAASRSRTSARSCCRGAEDGRQAPRVGVDLPRADRQRRRAIPREGALLAQRRSGNRLVELRVPAWRRRLMMPIERATSRTAARSRRTWPTSELPAARRASPARSSARCGASPRTSSAPGGPRPPGARRSPARAPRRDRDGARRSRARPCLRTASRTVPWTVPPRSSGTSRNQHCSGDDASHGA